MKKLFLTGIFFALLCSLHIPQQASAQLSIGAQLRTRAEFRDGQGAPLLDGSPSAFFISQRTRLSAGFSGYRFKIKAVLQDVRVWGQDASTINRTTIQDNNGLMLHEAWAEILLTDTTLKNKSLNLKIGRQELVYDDSRLLGNLDWLQQARRHDAAVIKYETEQWKLHAGFAYNQNKENATGTLYNPTPPGNYPANTNGGNMYKSLAYLYASKQIHTGYLSFLLLTDAFTKYHMASGVKIWDTGAWHRVTTGLYFTNKYKIADVTGSAYFQGGTSASGQDLNAYLFSVNAYFHLTKTFDAGPGFDYTTGGTSGTTNKAFDPLYGTPHKFWGGMDYFYAASAFGNRGLQDYYIKLKYLSRKDLTLNAEVHQFYSASDVPPSGSISYSRNFGTELDLIASYSLTKIIGIEGGYSYYRSTDALASPGVKNVTGAQRDNHWAYIMINIKPEFFFK